MKCRIRLSSTYLVALSLCGLWAGSAQAQDAPVDETSSTVGQDEPDSAQMPHLDADKTIVCIEDEAGETLRIRRRMLG